MIYFSVFYQFSVMNMHLIKAMSSWKARTGRDMQASFHVEGKGPIQREREIKNKSKDTIRGSGVMGNVYFGLQRDVLSSSIRGKEERRV